jgi:hypothetical protein
MIFAQAFEKLLQINDVSPPSKDDFMALPARVPIGKWLGATNGRRVCKDLTRIS